MNSLKLKGEEGRAVIRWGGGDKERLQSKHGWVKGGGGGK